MNYKQIRNLIILAIVLFMALWNYTLLLSILMYLLGLISPFILGACIAFVLNVPMSFLENKIFLHGKREKTSFTRAVSLILTFLLGIGVILLVMCVVIPEVVNTLAMLGNLIPAFCMKVVDFIEELGKENPEILDLFNNILSFDFSKFDWKEIVTSTVNFLRNGADSIFGSTFTMAKSVVNGVMNTFIGIVFACYILLQKEELGVRAKKFAYAFFPEKWAVRLLSTASLAYRTFANFLTGQCLEAVILGTMFVVVMSILGLPYALMVGVLIAFTALIPIFGAFIGCVIATFLILMVNPVQALIFLIVFFVLQQIEGNLIYPHVVGGSVGLPSIWVLAAVTVGGSMMGILGMLVFIPGVSVCYAILRQITYKRLAQRPYAREALNMDGAELSQVEETDEPQE